MVIVCDQRLLNHTVQQFAIFQNLSFKRLANSGSGLKDKYLYIVFNIADSGGSVGVLPI